MSKTSDYRQDLTNQIINLLEKGTVPWQSGWQINDNRLFNRPYNPHSEKAYRGMNSLYLTIVSNSEKYTDPRWCTFKQANDKGWRIKAGEHGKVIEFWKFTEKKESTDKDGNKVIEETPLKRPMVIRSVVFNAEQMTGVPPLEKREPNLWEAKNRAEKILTNSGAAIEHKANITPHYNIREDKILLPEKEQFKNAESYYATALHELGHWTGAESRLNRDILNIFGTPGYAREELRAELSSFFTASEIGIPNEIERHASYLDSWIKALKEDKNEIFKAAADAEKITDYVLKFEKEKTLNNEKPKTKNEAYALKSELAVAAKADVRLTVDYKDRRKAKELGAKWDKDLKTWFAPKGADLAKLSAFMGKKIVNLRNVPVFAAFEEKDEIKALGGRWNANSKSWYIPAGSDIKDIPDKFFTQRERESATLLTEVKQTFSEFAREQGLLLEGDPVADGKFHRVPVENGKPGAKDGSYVYFDDEGGKAGWIKNFKTGFEGSFGETKERTAAIKTLSEAEKSARAEERKAGYDEAAKKAEYLVTKKFQRAARHPYLEAKGIKPHLTFIDKDKALIIPLRDINGDIRTFQRISEDGTKAYMKGGEKSGAFYTFGWPRDKVIVCEGFATGASIYESTGIPTVSAMDAGNLERVATDVRAKYGEKMIMAIAADNDHNTPENPGLKYAEKSAASAGASVLVPQFTQEEKAKNFTDFNDLASGRGKHIVKEQILNQDKRLEEKIIIKSLDMEK